MKEFQVLIGESEPLMVELLGELIEDVVGKESAITIYNSAYLDELREFADQIDFKIFILTVNNIMLRSTILPYEERVHKVLELVSEIKAKYGVPIIIMGVEYLLTDEVMKSDADAIVKTPFKLDYFKEKLANLLQDCRV
nr:hypothetical protein [candidate division Zixibacteria bacterium]